MYELTSRPHYHVVIADPPFVAYGRSEDIVPDSFEISIVPDGVPGPTHILHLTSDKLRALGSLCYALADELVEETTPEEVT